MERSNKLCNAYVLFNHIPSVIKGFEIITCREFNDYQGGVQLCHLGMAPLVNKHH